MAEQLATVALLLVTAGLLLTLLALRGDRRKWINRRVKANIPGGQWRQWRRDTATVLGICLVAAGFVTAGAFASPAAAPTITSLNPPGGPAAGGNLVTIAGTNMCGTTAVEFGSGRPAPGLVVNSNGTAIAVNAPAGTGVVDLVITTPDGHSPVTPADRYSYQPALSVVTTPGVRSPGVDRARPLGPMTPSETLSLQVVLPMRNLADLQARNDGLTDPDSPFFQQFLTPDEITASYGPTRQQLDTVEDSLHSRGLTVGTESPQRTFVNVSAPVSVVERAFALHMWRFHEDSTARDFYASDTDPSFPTAIAPLILTVIGLDNYVRLQPNIVFPCTRSPHPDGSSNPDGRPQRPCAAPKGKNTVRACPPCPNVYGYTPAQLREAYGVNSLQRSALCKPCDGTGQNIGILEFGTTWSPSDETIFDIAYGLSPPATIAVCPSDPKNCPRPRGRNSDAQIEADLDVQVVHAIAPKAHVTVYEADNTINSYLPLLTAVMRNNPPTTVNSISWGACENDFNPGALHAIDQQLAALAATKRAVFVASGDNGRYCHNTRNDITAAQFPASDPHVTAVGGTNLFLNSDDSYAFEYAWSDSGGGASTIFTRPTWQQGPGVTPGPSACGRQKNMPCRLVPDVAADAYMGGTDNSKDWANPTLDPILPNLGATGYSIYTTTGNCEYFGERGKDCWQAVGGTSAASPLWAALVAIYNEYAAAVPGAIPLAGSVNSQLYNLARYHHRYNGAITDINGNPPSTTTLRGRAGPGWDPATGVGAPQLKLLAQNLAGLEVTPSVGPVPSDVVLSGTSFLPDETVVAKATRTGLTFCSASAVSDGSFQCHASIPYAALFGPLQISAKGLTSHVGAVTVFKAAGSAGSG